MTGKEKTPGTGMVPVGAPIEAETRVLTQDYSREQRELVKRTIAKGATDDELALFFETCRHLELDPFRRQIYFIKRRVYNKDTRGWDEVGTMQVSIDGLRAIAERSKEYAGQDAPIFEHDPTTGALLSATVAVYRKGWERPVEATAYWEEYAEIHHSGDNKGQPRAMWAKMPRVMLAKCAEAAALRKAFPQDIGPIYIEEELQAEADVEPSTREMAGPPAPKISAPEPLPAPPEDGKVPAPPAEPPKGMGANIKPSQYSGHWDAKKHKLNSTAFVAAANKEGVVLDDIREYFNVPLGRDIPLTDYLAEDSDRTLAKLIGKIAAAKAEKAKEQPATPEPPADDGAPPPEEAPASGQGSMM